MFSSSATTLLIELNKNYEDVLGSTSFPDREEASQVIDMIIVNNMLFFVDETDRKIYQYELPFKFIKSFALGNSFFFSIGHTF